MKRASLAIASALAFAALSSNACAGLVTNGGFENGLTGWTLAADPQNTFVTSGFSHSGNSALWMGEVGGLGTLSQTLSTVVGRTYNLTFWFAGDGDTPSEFQALIGSTVLLDKVNPSFDADYVPYSYNFFATSPSTLLSFKFRDDAFYINLDDVDVLLTPEPESLTLVLAGLLALGASRAARRRSVAKAYRAL